MFRILGPHPEERAHSASKTRVNALMLSVSKDGGKLGARGHPSRRLLRRLLRMRSGERTAPQDEARSYVPILRSGVLAQKFCAAGARATVAAVFERSFYLRSGDAFICVGAPAIGNGPLNLIADLGRMPDVKLPSGQPALVCDRHITIGNSVRLTLDQSEPWLPPAWPICLIWPLETCAALTHRAVRDAPQEGLARVVLGASETSRTPMTRTARAHIESFEGWLANGFVAGVAPETNLRKAVQGLIGLGPGLTPSGDDFLVGALALLDALGERAAHAALAGTITDALHLTAPLSACFLRAAAAGHISENLHLAVSSVMTGDVDAAIAAIEKIGHSSGWDMMAGIGVTLRVAASARIES